MQCMPARLGGETLPVAAWHARTHRSSTTRAHTPSLTPPCGWPLLISRQPLHVISAAPHDGGARLAAGDVTSPNLHTLATALQRYAAPMASLSAAVMCLVMFGGGSAGLPFASATVAKQLTPAASAVAISSAWAGLAAGCLHTLAGADHLAALTPLTIGVSHLKASLLGALWGFGHSVGQLLLGLCMVLLKDRFEALVPAIGRFGGMTVGIILVIIGVTGLVEGLHGHDHDGDDVSPAAAVDGGGVAVAKDEGRFRFATFATGVVYGLHPDALFVVIPALTLPTKLAAAAYILMFVMGTIIAMGSYTAVIGATTKAIEERNAWLASKLSSVASVLAMCVGATILAGEFGLAVPFSLTLFGHAH